MRIILTTMIKKWNKKGNKGIKTHKKSLKRWNRELNKLYK